MPQLHKTLGNEGGGKLVLKTAPRIAQPHFANPMNTNFIEDFRATMANHDLIPPNHIEPGKMHRFPTNGRKSDSSGWCRLYLDGRAGVFGDFRKALTCHWSGRGSKPPTLALRQQRAVELKETLAEVARVQAIQWARAEATNTTIWNQAIPISADDPVARYLAGRGLGFEAWPSALRYHSGLEFWQDGNFLRRFPAMLGEVTDAHGKRVSLHRTYLTQDGQKAPVDVVKKLTASSQKIDGCSIKLLEPQVIEGRLTLGIAQSIESALACAERFNIPTLSVCSDLGVQRFCVPEAVETLKIYCDNDMTSSDAMASLVYNAKSRSRAICFFYPPSARSNWVDYLAAQAKG